LVGPFRVPGFSASAEHATEIVLAPGDVGMCVHRPIDSSTPLVKLDSRVEPRAYLREATLRAVRNPGMVTLTRELKSSESFEKFGS
jgi:hypothetical protein